MRSSDRSLAPLASLLALAASSSCGGDGATMRADTGPMRADTGGVFVCQTTSDHTCQDNVWITCVRDGEFLRSERQDCTALHQTCVEATGGCALCLPGEAGCIDGNAALCRADGSGWDVVDECHIEDGEACDLGQCVNLCEKALMERSYVGCDFWAVDLDNAAVAVGRDASAQQFSIMVSNPNSIPSEVTIEINDAPLGMPARPRAVARETVLPNDLEVFNLPRREVDGSDGVRLNDGTHSHLSSNAYHVRAVLPVIAVQFNPLDNVGVFSNDASLLYPTSAIDDSYAILSWPQTIADTNDDTCRPDPTMMNMVRAGCPLTDFSPDERDEDLRAFLTVVGTADNTHVEVTFGPDIHRVIGLMPDEILEYRDVVNVTLNRFDVLNLETDDFMADFTGTHVRASAPVTVFAGSEASDAPTFEDLTTRQCCADHLEEQMLPISTLGRSFVVARMPPRSRALNAAFVDPVADHVAEVNEPEYVRIMAVAEGSTSVTTTLPPPNDVLDLGQDQYVTIDARQDFLIDASQAIEVLQVSPSQEATGIDADYPGGDPAMIVVPPRDQWRDNYVFLTPDKYAFDFVVVVAAANAQILLDGHPLPRDCDVGAADGVPRLPTDPPPDLLVYRCQLTFPDVYGRPNVRVEPGDQTADGYHSLVADQPVELLTYGFDSFVSYGYAAGLNLTLIH